MNRTSELSDRDWSRRVFILLTFAVILNGCTSIVKQQYLRHLSTTTKPAPRQADTMAVPAPGPMVVAASNTPHP